MILLFIFLIGICVGSFINVLESRLYKEEDIFKKPSHCDFCGKKLRWIDMFPVVSWIIYGGKSRCCRRRLSWQYPIVELVTGVGFVVIFWIGSTQIFYNNLTIQQFSNLIFLFVIFILCFAIFIQDLKYQAIHGGLLKALVFITFIFTLYQFLFYGRKFEILNSKLETNSNFQILNSILNSKFLQNIITAFISALPFYVLFKLSHEKWLGEGDVWISFWMGLFLGIKVFWAIYFGVILGGFVSLIVLLLHLKKMRDTISLGPFLLLGVLISLFL